MGERLVVQFARGNTRPREGFENAPRMAPRPRRNVHRMTISGLPFETSWQVSTNYFAVPRCHHQTCRVNSLSFMICLWITVIRNYLLKMRLCHKSERNGLGQQLTLNDRTSKTLRGLPV